MKPTKTLLVSAALILGTMGVQAADFVQNGNYLTVQLKQHQNYGPSQIRLQVVNDRIIRVQATAEQGFRSKQSLIIVPQNSKAQYKVEEQGDDLIITTAAMRAVLNEATGQITFYDLKDQVLLKEVAQGERLSSLSPCPTVKSVWISPRYPKHRSTDGRGVPSSIRQTMKPSMVSVSTRARSST